MSILAAIGAGLAAIGTFISTAISTVGPVIATAVSTFVAKLPPALEVAQKIVNIASTVMTGVSAIMNLGPEDEDVAALGAKTMQDNVRPKAEGESAKEYLDYLRNDVTLNEEEFDELSDYDKMRCEALGTFMIAKSIEERAGVELSPDFVMAISKAKLSAEQTEKLISAMSEVRMESQEIYKYISRAPEMTLEEKREAERVVIDAIAEVSPELSEDEIKNEVMEMKQEYWAMEESIKATEKE